MEFSYKATIVLPGMGVKSEILVLGDSEFRYGSMIGGCFESKKRECGLGTKLVNLQFSISDSIEKYVKREAEANK